MALTIAAYPPFRDEAASLNASLEQLPDVVKSLVSDTGDFFSPAGYMSSQVYYLVLPIVLAILAIGLGSSLLARDEESHTLELLLSRPVSRGRVLAAKALVGLCVLGIVTAVTLVTTLIGAGMINLGLAVQDIVNATLMAALLALLFGALAFMLTAMGSALRAASIGLSALVMLGSYLMTSLSSTVAWMETPSKFLPYHYYHPADLLAGDFIARDAIGLGAVAVAFGIISYVAFRRRDIA